MIARAQEEACGHYYNGDNICTSSHPRGGQVTEKNGVFFGRVAALFEDIYLKISNLYQKSVAQKNLHACLHDSTFAVPKGIKWF